SSVCPCGCISMITRWSTMPVRSRMNSRPETANLLKQVRQISNVFQHVFAITIEFIRWVQPSRLHLTSHLPHGSVPISTGAQSAARPPRRPPTQEPPAHPAGRGGDRAGPVQRVQEPTIPGPKKARRPAPDRGAPLLVPQARPPPAAAEPPQPAVVVGGVV